jgi:hypothetical protein
LRYTFSFIDAMRIRTKSTACGTHSYTMKYHRQNEANTKRCNQPRIDHLSCLRSPALAMADLVVRPLRALTMKTTILAILFSVSNACFGDVGELSRTMKFASPEQFAETARNFRPATKPSELSYIFAAPELGNDDSTYGKTVFADVITTVAEISRTPDLCAYFVQAEPKTDYTRSYSAGLFILRRGDGGAWRIATIERFYAIGVGGWIECRVIHQSAPLTVRITETDAGRHDVLQERVHTLTDAHGIRLKPVSSK